MQDSISKRHPTKRQNFASSFLFVRDVFPIELYAECVLRLLFDPQGIDSVPGEIPSCDPQDDKGLTSVTTDMTPIKGQAHRKLLNYLSILCFH